MPGTHRTPPNTDGAALDLAEALLIASDGTLRPDRGTLRDALLLLAHGTEGGDFFDAFRDFMCPALVDLLTVDARRALTRDLAAQDGDAVVDLGDLDAIRDVLSMVSKPAAYRGLKVRLRAAVEATRPTPAASNVKAADLPEGLTTRRPRMPHAHRDNGWARPTPTPEETR